MKHNSLRVRVPVLEHGFEKLQKLRARLELIKIDFYPHPDFFTVVHRRFYYRGSLFYMYLLLLYNSFFSILFLVSVLGDDCKGIR